jgi:hypothetical protein
MNGKKFSIKKGFIVREIAGEFLAVPIDSTLGGNIVVLNPVSKFLWDEPKEEKTFEELLDALLKNYQVPAEEAEADLKEFLMQMLESDLLN